MAHLLCAVEGELNFSNAAAVDATIENASLWTRLCFPSLAYFEKKHVRRRRRGRCSVRDLLSVGSVRARLVELLRTAQRARLIGHHLCTLLPVHRHRHYCRTQSRRESSTSVGARSSAARSRR